MKKTLFIAIAAACLLLTSCASTSNAKIEAHESDENYLGDFAPFQLDSAMSLKKNMAGVLSPCELELFCVPRTNTIECYFNTTMSRNCLMLSYSQRKTLREGFEAYLAAYEAKQLPKESPSKKNAFINGECSFAWGLLGPTSTTDTKFRVNYEYVNDLPYCLLYIDSSTAENDSSNWSPVTKMYFSPSQLELLFDATDDEAISEYINQLVSQAYTF